MSSDEEYLLQHAPALAHDGIVQHVAHMRHPNEFTASKLDDYVLMRVDYLSDPLRHQTRAGSANSSMCYELENPTMIMPSGKDDYVTAIESIGFNFPFHTRAVSGSDGFATSGSYTHFTANSNGFMCLLTSSTDPHGVAGQASFAPATASSAGGTYYSYRVDEIGTVTGSASSYRFSFSSSVMLCPWYADQMTVHDTHPMSPGSSSIYGGIWYELQADKMPSATGGHHDRLVVEWYTWPYHVSTPAGAYLDISGAISDGDKLTISAFTGYSSSLPNSTSSKWISKVVTKTYKALNGATNGALDGSDILFDTDSDLIDMADNLKAAIDSAHGHNQGVVDSVLDVNVVDAKGDDSVGQIQLTSSFATAHGNSVPEFSASGFSNVGARTWIGGRDGYRNTGGKGNNVKFKYQAVLWDNGNIEFRYDPIEVTGTFYQVDNANENGAPEYSVGVKAQTPTAWRIDADGGAARDFAWIMHCHLTASFTGSAKQEGVPRGNDSWSSSLYPLSASTLGGNSAAASYTAAGTALSWDNVEEEAPPSNWPNSFHRWGIDNAYNTSDIEDGSLSDGRVARGSPYSILFVRDPSWFWSWMPWADTNRESNDASATGSYSLTTNSIPAFRQNPFFKAPLDLRLKLPALYPMSASILSSSYDMPEFTSDFVINNTKKQTGQERFHTFNIARSQSGSAYQIGTSAVSGTPTAPHSRRSGGRNYGIETLQLYPEQLNMHQVPLSKAIKGPSNLRGRKTPYVVSQGGDPDNIPNND